MTKKRVFNLIILLCFICVISMTTVRTANADSPKIRIVSPEEDRIWIGVKRITVEVEGIDPSFLSSVAVFLDGKLIKEFKEPPYSFKYNFGPAPANRTLEVLAHTMSKKKMRHTITSYYTDDTHTVNVMQVVVPVAVMDKRGNYITGLEKGDFEITEDGVKQDVSYFTTTGKSGFHLVLLIDISSSMKDKIADVKDIAQVFLKQLLRKEDQAIIVFFNHDVFEDSDFTNDINELSNSLSIAFPFGATALYDAIAYSVKLLKSIIGQNIIILFSDGEDNSSAIDPYTLMKIVERSNSVIYSIGRQMDDYNQYQDLLKQIANSSGGMPFFFDETSDIQKLYQKIRQDIQAKYVLQFSPKRNNKENRFRKIEVELSDTAKSRLGKKCKIRTMKGYYY